MKYFFAFLFCLGFLSVEAYGDEAYLKAYYSVEKKNDVFYYIFRIEKTTDEDVMLAHLNFSQFSWQVSLENGKHRLFTCRLPNSRPIGYTLMSKSKLEFVLRSDRDNIISNDAISDSSHVILQACLISKFQGEGRSALVPLEIPLLLAN